MRKKPSLFWPTLLGRGLASFKQKQIRSAYRLCQLHSHRLIGGSYGVPTESWLVASRRIALFSSKEQCASFSSIGWNSESYAKIADEGKISQLQVEILSRHAIKPSFSTPHHLRTYEVSLIDIVSPHAYMSFVYFYENGSSHSTKHCLENSLSNKRKLLRQSLSEVLTRFYPFAGKVKDERHIDCNDDGVYYVEAQVKNQCSLSEFLRKPANMSIHQFLPFHPWSNELLSQTGVTMIQVTTFKCGGIAIGIYTSHKIVDGFSHITFLKAWAAATRGYPELICPSFVSPSIFLPKLPHSGDTVLTYVPFCSNNNKCVVKRFVFPNSSLLGLKKKYEDSTSRVMAVTGLIWKCAIATSSKISSDTSRHYNLVLFMNIRNRSSPSLPAYSIGNLDWIVVAQYNANPDIISTSSTIQLLKNAAKKVNKDFIEKLKGEEGMLKIMEDLNNMNKLHTDENIEYMVVTSVCNFGMYEADFGWGKPIWISPGNVNADVPYLRNLVYLMDRGSGEGIEAWVSLSEEHMANFEQDPELLTFAYENPSPLDPQNIG